MRFTLPPGSEIVVEPCGELTPGEVYLFTSGADLVAHRLLKKRTGGLLIFRGEIAGAESEPVLREHVLGRVAAVIQAGSRRELGGWRHRLLARLWIRGPALARTLCAGFQLAARASGTLRAAFR